MNHKELRLLNRFIIKVRIEKNVTPKNRLDVIEEQLKEWNVTREEWSEAVNSDKLEKHVKKYPRTKKII